MGFDSSFDMLLELKQIRLTMQNFVALELLRERRASGTIDDTAYNEALNILISGILDETLRMAASQNSQPL